MKKNSLARFVGAVVLAAVGAAGAETAGAQSAEMILLSSAWFAHDDDRRGALAVGRLESLLTMVGGRIVYAAAPFAAVEDRGPAR